MNRTKPYIPPRLHIVNVETNSMLMSSSSSTYDNEVPGGGDSGFDVIVTPGYDDDGEDAGDAF